MSAFKMFLQTIAIHFLPRFKGSVTILRFTTFICSEGVEKKGTEKINTEYKRKEENRIKLQKKWIIFMQINI